MKAVAALVPLVARLLLASIFFYSGWNKLAAPGQTASRLAGHHLPFASASAYAAGAFELAVALLLAIGLKARAAAVAAFAYVALVSWIFHWHAATHGDPSQMIQLLKNAALGGGLLLLAHAGAGPASIDRS